jgi:hypothetical protein
MANTLFDLAQQYLQQGLPDITGIFPPPVATTQPVAPMLPVMPISQQPAGIETLFPTEKASPRDDFPGGGGPFGDLDMSDKKTITRNVYTEIGPNKYGFVPTEIDAFRNMRTGAYQTADGKNVDATFTDIPGGVLNIMSNVFDPKPEFFAEYPLGKIEGAYTNLASLLKGERNPTNLITAARQRLIDRGSRITEDFEGAGEFPTEKTPITTGSFEFEDQSYEGGKGGSGGRTGPGDMDKGVGGQSMGPGGPGGPRQV